MAPIEKDCAQEDRGRASDQPVCPAAQQRLWPIKRVLRSLPTKPGKRRQTSCKSPSIAVECQPCEVPIDPLRPKFGEHGLAVDSAFVFDISRCMDRLYSVLYPVAVEGNPYIIAHTDGRAAISMGPTLLLPSKTTPESRAELFLANLFGIRNAYAFLAGWLGRRRVRIIAAPLNLRPPEGLIVDTPQQREQRQRLRPGFYYMTVAALAGTALFPGAATAYARVVSLLLSLIHI